MRYITLLISFKLYSMFLIQVSKSDSPSVITNPTRIFLSSSWSLLLLSLSILLQLLVLLSLLCTTTSNNDEIFGCLSMFKIDISLKIVAEIPLLLVHPIVIVIVIIIIIVIVNNYNNILIVNHL